MSIMNRLSGMDNITEDKNKEEYNKIRNVSIAIFLVVISFYLLVMDKSVGLFGFADIKNETLREIVEWFLDFVATTVLFGIIYVSVSVSNGFLWKKKNAGIWVSGTWLHIHKKANGVIRIGYVEIAQDYYNIEVTGYNFPYPNDAKKDLNYTTKWYYNATNIFEEKYLPDVIGCYSTEHLSKKIGSTVNHGLHLLKINQKNNKGIPISMYGDFYDTVEDIPEGISDITEYKEIVTKQLNKYGKILLFRPGKELLDTLIVGGKFRNSMLEAILSDTVFSDEEFVIAMKEIING